MRRSVRKALHTYIQVSAAATALWQATQATRARAAMAQQPASPCGGGNTTSATAFCSASPAGCDPALLPDLAVSIGNSGAVLCPGLLHAAHAHAADTPVSAFTRLWRWLVPAALPQSPPPSPLKKPVKRLVTIGVHGWALLGGRWAGAAAGATTSAKLAKRIASAAVQRLEQIGAGCREHIDCASIALSGHGLVDQRLDSFVRAQLAAFEKTLYDADVILVAAHSQGCCVAALLLQHLVQRRLICVNRQKIGLLSIAGVFHGPYPDLPGDLHAATTELFSLSGPHSSVARRCLRAMAFLLRCRVRIMTIGAVDDAVVPMFSATAHSLRCHPDLIRGIFVDNPKQMSSFPVRLLLFCLHTRNMSTTSSDPVADLLVHVSGFLRGSLLRTATHSAAYECEQVYDAAAKWMLWDSAHRSVVGEDDAADSADLEEEFFVAHTSAHWAGVLTDSFYWSSLNGYFVRSRLDRLLRATSKLEEFQTELKELRESFSQWAPTSKTLKHLHKILEGMFSSYEEASANGGESVQSTRSRL